MKSLLLVLFCISFAIAATPPPVYNFQTPLTKSGVNVSCQYASTSQGGCVSQTDWNTFNNKQASGNYITALTGDISASGPGSASATLATVNSNVGSFTNASVTVNGKGLVTAASNGTTIPTTSSATNTTYYLVGVPSSSTGNQAPYMNSGFTFNPGTGYFQTPQVFTNVFTVLPTNGPADSTHNYGSGALNLDGYYWNGSASATDDWTFQSVLGAGTNPYSVFNIAHSGTPGAAVVYMPALDNTPIGPYARASGNFTTVNANAGVTANVTATTTSPQIDGSGSGTYTIANAANAAITSGTGTYFIALIAEYGVTASTSVWVLGGGYAGLLGLNAGTAWVASTNAPGAGHFSVAYSGSQYYIYNNYGSTCYFSVFLIRGF